MLLKMIKNHIFNKLELNVSPHCVVKQKSLPPKDPAKSLSPLFPFVIVKMMEITAIPK